MAKYAEGTRVPEVQSHMEIRKLLKKYGAEGTGNFEDERGEHLIFKRDGLTYRFTVPMEPETSDAERRRRLRAFVMVIKAKLVAIQDGIVTFEDEFIGRVITDDGRTVAERWGADVRQLALQGKIPSALPWEGSR